MSVVPLLHGGSRKIGEVARLFDVSCENCLAIASSYFVSEVGIGVCELEVTKIRSTLTSMYVSSCQFTQDVSCICRPLDLVCRFATMTDKC